MQKTADNLASKLSSDTPVISDEERATHAAVAVILCEIEHQPQVLFIQRSESPHDPWSGHLAFPGGRIDPTDSDLQVTAERETQEEIGLDLESAQYLGCLAPSATLNGMVQIASFVYTIESAPELTLDPVEVADTHWIPAKAILSPTRISVQEHEGVEYPAVDILGGHPLLWGLTLRICRDLLS